MATTYETEADAIRGEFNAQWDAVSYPVAWPNIDFTPPTDPDATTGWVRLMVRPADADQVELGPVGARRFRHVGVALVQVFTKDGTGDELNNQLCDTVAGIYRASTVSGVVFRAPYVQPVGSENGWFQQNVVVPYYRDSDF